MKELVFQHRGSFGPAIRRRLQRVWTASLRRFVDVVQRQRQRRALARLDDRLLRDVGITRAQAKAEAGKPFWRG